jgi:hypothetical protein
MSYDVREAEALFVRAHDRLDPHRRFAERAEAATELLRAALQAAKAAGYEVGSERGYYVVAQKRQGAVYLRVDDDTLRVTADPEPDPSKWNGFAIEYDPALRLFVGVAEDTFLHPVPGEPRARRSAAAVIAELIVKMIDAQAAAKARR